MDLKGLAHCFPEDAPDPQPLLSLGTRGFLGGCDSLSAEVATTFSALPPLASPSGSAPTATANVLADSISTPVR